MFTSLQASSLPLSGAIIRRLLWLLGLGALFLASRTANAQPADSLLLRGKELLSEGVTAGNGSTVARARSLFERATDAGARAALSRYYLGLASYRLVDLVADEDRGADFMEDAQAQLETVLDLRPEWAEADALLSGIYGRKAERGMLSGMRYGPKANQALTRAKERAPNNPRVLLMEGIGLYNTPSMWGGDKAKAVEHLREAITRFEEASPDDPLQPDWGHADAYAWLGIAHADANRTDAARAAFQNALHVRPGYVWVERVLMPELASAD